MQRQLLNTLGRGTRQLIHGQQMRPLSVSAQRREIFKVQSAEDFDKKVKNSQTPVIVDFFATWCNPCKLLTPRIENIVGENAGSIKLAKVDIDEHSELALDYDVGAVPVLVVLQNGKEIKRMVGLQDEDKIRAWVAAAVKESKN
ncbi:GL24652 [Drosophila persimilis]|uniref:GL24652 n=1 Tax=Drosophila persimilis TaxID=7234 RepID=B4H5V2_DROPE|nr:thioredoxin, mitochondrial [Drosophila persimilis]XP_017157098.1 thioredoxin, mitochondrial [Drosophila miranda]EDW33169.1 GL24652 [Drosophila persimilis]